MHTRGGGGRAGNKQDTLHLPQHPPLQSCHLSQKKTKHCQQKQNSTSYVQGFRLLSPLYGIPKHIVVFQHLCAYTTSELLLQAPSPHLLTRKPVHLRTAKFSLHIVTTFQGGDPITQKERKRRYHIKEQCGKETGAGSSQKGLERWYQLAKKMSNRARTHCLWLVSLAGAMEKEHPANPPGTRLHGQSSHSSASEGWVELEWAIPFVFGPQC